MWWSVLLCAALCEIVWAVGLKSTEGFTRPWPTALVAGFLILSCALLGLAARHLPIGTAYAVWTGIGALGTAVAGILLHGEPATPARLCCIGLIVAGVAGLKHFSD